MTATVNTNILIGDDSAELIRGGTGVISYLSGSGGNDTIIGAINAVAPGSTLEGGAGNDSLVSDGIGDIVLGGEGNDTLVNESGQASLLGGAGNDAIFALDSQVTMSGGLGDDLLVFSDESNLGFGGDGNDQLIGQRGDDIFIGGVGNDYIDAAANSKDATILFGNSGNDTLDLGFTSADSAYGGQGNDSVYAGTGASAANQFLSGDKGADTITYLGSGENVILDGDRSASGQGALGTDAGNDVFSVAKAKGMFVLGGGGNDSLSGSLGAESSVFMGKGDDFFNVVSTGSSNISGDLGNDSGSITLAGKDTLWADGNGVFAGTDAVSGNDNFIVTATTSGNTIYGDLPTGTTGGNDTLSVTGSGNAVIGGGGNDSLVSSGGNTLTGGAGNDFYSFGAGDVIPFDSLGNNTYIAGPGASATDRVTVQPGDSFTGGATFVVNGESELIKKLTSGGVIASDDRDFIEITGTSDGLTSLKGGNDTFSGNDLIAKGSVFGDAGDDYLKITGSAEGLVDGGAGNDLLEFTGPSVTSPIVGGVGNDTLAVDGIFAGSASGVETFDIGTIGAGASITATTADDEIIIPGVGTAPGNVTINAGAGNDTLSVGSSATGSGVALIVDGGEGNDLIYGKASGGDSLLGGAGNDTIFGGGFSLPASPGSSTAPLRDTLIGGAGADVFIVGTTAKLGFIGLELNAQDAGSNFFGVPSYISGGTSAADNSNVGAKTIAYNGIEHVDVIVGFNPAEGDVIIFNTKTGGGAGLPVTTGTSATEIGGGASTFQSGSIAYLGNNTSAGGYFRSISATTTGTANTFGLLGANPTGDFKFDGKLTGTSAGELSGAVKSFTYDTNTGGLYLNDDTTADRPKLVAIFDGAPALTNTSIQSLPFGNTTTGIPTI